MNDFTKEELEYMLYAVGYAKTVGLNSKGYIPLLRSKIKVMIHEHCEPEVACIVIDRPEKGGDVSLVHGTKMDLGMQYEDGEELVFLDDHSKVCDVIRRLNG